MIKSTLLSSFASNDVWCGLALSRRVTHRAQVIDSVCFNGVRAAAVFISVVASLGRTRTVLDTQVRISLLAKRLHVVGLPRPFALLTGLCAHLDEPTTTSASPLHFKNFLSGELTVHETWLAQLVGTRRLNTRQGELLIHVREQV